MGTSYDALVDLFESIEHLLRRLEICTEIPLTPILNEMVVKIMMELLSTLALVTKEINHGRSSASVSVDKTRYFTLIDVKQQDLQRSGLERRTSRRYCKGSTDSRKTRLRQLQRRFSKLFTVISRI